MQKSIYSHEYKDFINKLKQARIDAALTQKEVAKTLEVSQGRVSKWENGDIRIDVFELKTIAQLYKKPVSFFIDLD